MKQGPVKGPLFPYPEGCLAAVAATAAKAIATAAEQNDQDYDNPQTTIAAAKKAIITHSGLLLNIFFPESGSVHLIHCGKKRYRQKNIAAGLNRPLGGIRKYCIQIVGVMAIWCV